MSPRSRRCRIRRDTKYSGLRVRWIASTHQTKSTTADSLTEGSHVDLQDLRLSHGQQCLEQAHARPASCWATMAAEAAPSMNASYRRTASSSVASLSESLGW